MMQWSQQVTGLTHHPFIIRYCINHSIAQLCSVELPLYGRRTHIMYACLHVCLHVCCRGSNALQLHCYLKDAHITSYLPLPCGWDQMEASRNNDNPRHGTVSFNDRVQVAREIWLV